MRPCFEQQGLREGGLELLHNEYLTTYELYLKERGPVDTGRIELRYWFPGKPFSLIMEDISRFWGEVWLLRRVSGTHEVRRLLESAVLRSFT